MVKTRIFYAIAAFSAFTTAVTTFLLWLLPRFYAAPATFEEGVALAANPYYMARQWINLLHIPFALVAYFGLAYKLRQQALPQAGLGLLWFVVWGLTEMAGIATIIFAVNKNWRAAYAMADAAHKTVLRAHIESFYAVWDSLFFVLLIAFLLGTSFYGWATWRSQGLEKRLSGLFWLAAPLTVLILLSGYAGAAWAATITMWIYPLLQPVSRFVLGLVLLKRDA